MNRHTQHLEMNNRIFKFYEPSKSTCFTILSIRLNNILKIIQHPLEKNTWRYFCYVSTDIQVNKHKITSRSSTSLNWHNKSRKSSHSGLVSSFLSAVKFLDMVMTSCKISVRFYFKKACYHLSLHRKLKCPNGV